MEELLTFFIVAAIVFLIFGVVCSDLAKKRQAGHNGAWFVVGFCLGPLGLGLVLLTHKLQEGDLLETEDSKSNMWKND